MVDRKLLLRVEEAAEKLSIGRSKMYELLAAGEIQPIRVGRSVRVSSAALEEWVARQERRDEVASVA